MEIEIFNNRSLKACFKDAFTDISKNALTILKKSWYAMLVFAFFLSVTQMFRVPSIELAEWGQQHGILSFSLQTIVYLLTIVSLAVPFWAFTKLINQKFTWKKISNCCRYAAHHPGEMLITLVLNMLLTIVVMTIIALPATILFLAQTVSQLGIFDGDAPAMPGFFYPLLFFALLFTNFVFAYVVLYNMLTITKLLGSFKVQEQEQKKFIVTHVASAN